ncbi:hypothetical protein FRB96_005239 [Tulasnella sp. 330]|nr:hypothetical protein FRB96_005239 [Tulasnella sp. 330]
MAEVNGPASDTREQRFSNKGELNELHKQLSKQREREIQTAIAAGLVDDPTVRRTLDNAIAIVGTCEDFCSQFEKVERHLRNEVKRPEMIPGTDEPDYARMVKAFARPNDSNNVKLPSEIRPPPVLQAILAQASSWIGVQEFIFDRTRAIRQDFTIQGGRSLIAVECHERIARFLILSLHESKSEEGQEDQEWEAELRAAHSFTLDIEQLNKTLTTLMQYYDDFRPEGVSFPNEPEFRAYRLLLQLRDADVARRTQSIPSALLASPYTQSALNLRNLAQHPSSIKTSHPGPRATAYAFTRVLKEMRSDRVTFLMACLMETHFNGLRKECLRAMAASYISKTVPMEKVTRILGFESDERAEDFVRDCGLTLEESISGQGSEASRISSAVINRNERNNFSDAAPRESKTQSALLIAKRGLYTWTDLLDGLTPPPNLSKPVSSTAFPTLSVQSIPATRLSSKAPSVSIASSIPISQTSAFSGFGQSNTSGFGTQLSSGPAQAPKYPFGAAPSTSGSAFGASAFGSGGYGVFNGPTEVKPSNFGSSAVGAQTLPPKPPPAVPQQPPSSSSGLLIPSQKLNLFSSNPFAFSSAASKMPVPSIQPPPLPQPGLSPFAKPFVPSFAAPPSAKQQLVIPTVHSAHQLPSAPITSSSSLSSPSRKPSVPVAHKPSLPPQPASPPISSPRTVSRLQEARDTAVMSTTIDSMVRAIAQFKMAEVIADEWSRRRQIRPLVRIWKWKALQNRERGRAEEEKLRKIEEERAARWGKLMGVLGTSRTTTDKPMVTAKGKGKGKAVESRRQEPLTGEGMLEAVQSALSERDLMWEKGVFLEAVNFRVRRMVAAMREQVPSDWTVWLTRCEDELSTWQWLRIKFGVEDGIKGDLIALPVGAGIAQQDGPSYPGLIVFEVPPRLSTLTGRSSEAVWSASMRSLSGVLAALPKNRPYHPSLIALYWGAGSSSLESQRSSVLNHFRNYLHTSHAGLVLDVRVVVFEGSTGHQQAFDRAVDSIALDVSGTLINRTPLEDVVSAFAVAWERALMEGLAICENVHLDRPSATWQALSGLFALLVDSLNEMQNRVSELADIITEESLPPFSGAGLTDETSFTAYLIQYLGTQSLAENAILAGLRSELIHLQKRKQALPIQPTVEQIAWQLTCRLASLANEVTGNTWKASLSDFEERNLRQLGDLRQSFPLKMASSSESHDHAMLKHQAAPAIKKKRPRNPSGDREQISGLEKRSRSVVSEDDKPQAPRQAFVELQSQELANELLDLEKLLAQSEAMLAA